MQTLKNTFQYKLLACVLDNDVLHIKFYHKTTRGYFQIVQNFSSNYIQKISQSIFESALQLFYYMVSTKQYVVMLKPSYLIKIFFQNHHIQRSITLPLENTVLTQLSLQKQQKVNISLPLNHQRQFEKSNGPYYENLIGNQIYKKLQERGFLQKMKTNIFDNIGKKLQNLHQTASKCYEHVEEQNKKIHKLSKRNGCLQKFYKGEIEYANQSLLQQKQGKQYICQNKNQIFQHVQPIFLMSDQISRLNRKVDCIHIQYNNYQFEVTQPIPQGQQDNYSAQQIIDEECSNYTKKQNKIFVKISHKQEEENIYKIIFKKNIKASQKICVQFNILHCAKGYISLGILENEGELFEQGKSFPLFLFANHHKKLYEGSQNVLITKNCICSSDAILFQFEPLQGKLGLSKHPNQQIFEYKSKKLNSNAKSYEFLIAMKNRGDGVEMKDVKITNQHRQ